MGLLDSYYAYKALNLLTKDWTDTEAFELGLVDDKGKLLKKPSRMTSKEKKAYTLFTRLIFNLRKEMQKIPGLKSKLGRYSSALYLIREHLGIDEFMCLAEEVATNNTGNIAGVDKPLGSKPHSRFCDVDVFIVDGDTYKKCIHGKQKYKRWNKYVDVESSLGHGIREYARKYPKRSIIIQDERTSAMIYLKRG